MCPGITVRPSLDPVIYSTRIRTAQDDQECINPFKITDRHTAIGALDNDTILVHTYQLHSSNFLL